MAFSLATAFLIYAVMAFSLTGIEKTYVSAKSTTRALEAVSFTVHDGEFVSLIGPSGCGKSTLLFIAAGLEPASAGQITLDGRLLAGPGRERGMVFQSYTLFPWLSVRENVRFSHELRANQNFHRPMSEILAETAYADRLIEIMGLESFAHSLPRELSGGMKQRVAIARALANRPRILLMDEPFGALDAQTREEMQELMLLLSIHERTTTLFVTHDIEEALYLSTRILVCSAHPGRIVEEITVPFPPDRTLAIKMEPEFLRLKRHLLDTLHGSGRTAMNRSAILDRLKNKPGRTGQTQPTNP